MTPAKRLAFRFFAQNREAALVDRLAAIAFAWGCALHASPGVAQAPQVPPGFVRVELASAGTKAAPIAGYLRRPASDRPAPAVVALHGCSGLFTQAGQMRPLPLDWTDRLVAAGYAVLWTDSFNPRGYKEVCTLDETSRPIRPFDRSYDAAAAADWLAEQAFVDKGRIALMGWSHGGSSALWTIRREFAPKTGDFKAAVAFYPGCRPMAASARWAPRLPVTILIGDADDWTPPEPCHALASKHGFRLISYAGAVHGFDAPNVNRQTRSGVGLGSQRVTGVQIGTDPAARAAAIVEVQRLLAEAFR